jgi:hypothetical protein
MDRQLLQQHLGMVERHVVEGDGHVMRQRELVAKLERTGRDTTHAKMLLRQFQELQALHIEHRDRLRNELG